MDENQQSVQYNEIDLRDIFMILWKKKIMIISTTLIGAILAGLLSVFVLTPVYDTVLKIDLNIPETYNTRYGEYKVPISSNGQYIDLIKSNDVITSTISHMGYTSNKLTLQKFKEKIVIGKINETAGTKQNIFDVTVSAKTPEESLKLAQTLYASYQKYLDVISNEKALNFFNSSLSASIESDGDKLESTKEILKQNEELLAKTPQTIDQGSLNHTNNLVIQEIINPKYSEIQKDIVENKQLIFTTKETINTNKGYIKDIKESKSILKKYNETGKIDRPESRVINFIDTNIFLASTPVAPTEKTSPSNAKSVAIGFVIGGMLACGLVLIKEYWFKKA